MERRERNYRGISGRAAIGYLESVGGNRTDDRTVEGEGWQASIVSDTVEIGPTLELTELTIQFEGDAETLDTVIDEFAQKAMRAGG